MDKKSKIILIISIISFALAITAVTYAYFSAKITGIESASTLSLNAGTMGIHYAEGNENVSISDMYPRSEPWITKTFTLTGNNNTDQTMEYEVGLDIITNTFKGGQLSFSLEVGNSNVGTSMSPVNYKSIIKPNGTMLIGHGAFPGPVTNGVQTYTLKIYFLDNGKNQNINQGAVFNAKITVQDRGSIVAINECITEKIPIESYTINVNNCMSFIEEDLGESATTEEKENFCSGGTIEQDFSTIDEDISNGNYEDYVNSGTIQNVVYNGDDITSYDINITNCKNLLKSWYVSETYQQRGCSGEAFPHFNYSIDNEIRLGYYEYYVEARIIENVIYGNPVPDPTATTFEKGQYIYTYRDTKNGWSVNLVDKNSTDPITTSLCTSINGKPIVSMAYLFANSAATSIDLSSFDTSNVTDMTSMFNRSKATSLDLSSFDTSNVTSMWAMFDSSAATTLDLSSFDTSNVTDMSSMFIGSQASTLDLSSFDTSNVTSMFQMFSISAATTLDLSTFDTSNVTDMSSMFSNSNAQTILFPKKWSTGANCSLSMMFSNSKASSLDLSSFDTSNVTDMRNMFFYSAATSIDLSSFDTSNVTSMSGMFTSSAATSLDLSTFDTSKVKYMSNMFSNSAATVGYARTQTDADRFNSVNNSLANGNSPNTQIPDSLTFIVKTN